jgi:GT2 family glycosyltransferase
VIVADSGSTDETVAKVRQFAPAATVVECGNVGYGAAANRGVAWAAGASWVMVCNMDLTFSAAVGGLIGRAGRGEFGEKVWCVAPGLVNENGTVQASVGAWPTLSGLLADQFRPREQRKYVFPQPTEAGEVAWVTGACLILKRAVYEELGGFDEKYFLYVEEVDLLRRGFEAGWRTWFEPLVRVTHHAPNASRDPRPEVQRWSARGLLRYFAKFGGWLSLRGYGLLAMLSGRLPFGEAFASRGKILERSTGP